MAVAYNISHKYKILLLTLLSILAFVGINLSGMPVKSISFRPSDPKAEATVVASPHMHQITSQKNHDVIVEFEYKGYGNTSLRLTPAKCLLPKYRINGKKVVFKPSNKNDLCTEMIVDFRDQLVIGKNILEMQLTPYESPRFKQYPFFVLLTAGAPLFGKDLLQSICTAIFIVSIASIIWINLKISMHDFITRSLFMAGCLLSLQWLYLVYQFIDSTDLDGHVAYINAMSNHFFRPYDYTGLEYWHPPLYYWICAIIVKILGVFGVIDPWTGIRFFSVILRAILLYYGMQCFRLFLKGHYLYLALGLLVTWPSGLYQSTYISNDVFYYAFYAACFFYTCLWHQTLSPQHLLKALIFCGLGFMAKTAGAVPAFVLAATLVSNLFYRRCTLKSLLNKKVILGCCVVAFGIIFNLGRWIHSLFWLNQGMPENYLGGLGYSNVSIQRVLSFNLSELIDRPFNLQQRYIYYINFLVTSILLTALTWKATAIASMLHVLHLSLLGFMATGIAAISPRNMKKMTPVFYGVILPFIAIFTFLVVRRIIWCLDFRFIQPALIPMIILIIIGIKSMQRWRWKLFHTAAIAAVIAFIELSIVLFQLQMLN
jgi:hypothetical protein